MAHFSCRRPQVVAGDNLGALTGQLGCRESAKGVDAGQFPLDMLLWRPEDIPRRYRWGDPCIREALDHGVVL
jgi:hypothetical protein